jgi:hypothetical protein
MDRDEDWSSLALFHEVGGKLQDVVIHGLHVVLDALSHCAPVADAEE